ncbi:hypothetical protein C0Q70_05229 [Pomacea canaliculata]|uniref:Uncharacterized protein n=1 Tax=Pomacea canaliculata TaxID=400727 RepID=A0A2T7PKQ9_POMCA|nr:hypothetical protein C0Q70_05229 [Pomacea canaliculata]
MSQTGSAYSEETTDSSEDKRVSNDTTSSGDATLETSSYSGDFTAITEKSTDDLTVTRRTTVYLDTTEFPTKHTTPPSGSGDISSGDMATRQTISAESGDATSGEYSGDTSRMPSGDIITDEYSGKTSGMSSGDVTAEETSGIPSDTLYEAGNDTTVSGTSTTTSKTKHFPVSQEYETSASGHVSLLTTEPLTSRDQDSYVDTTVSGEKESYSGDIRETSYSGEGDYTGDILEPTASGEEMSTHTTASGETETSTASGEEMTHTTATISSGSGETETSTASGEEMSTHTTATISSGSGETETSLKETSSLFQRHLDNVTEELSSGEWTTESVNASQFTPTMEKVSSSQGMFTFDDTLQSGSGDVTGVNKTVSADTTTDEASGESTLIESRLTLTTTQVSGTVTDFVSSENVTTMSEDTSLEHVTEKKTTSDYEESGSGIISGDGEISSRQPESEDTTAITSSDVPHVKEMSSFPAEVTLLQQSTETQDVNRTDSAITSESAVEETASGDEQLRTLESSTSTQPVSESTLLETTAWRPEETESDETVEDTSGEVTSKAPHYVETTAPESEEINDTFSGEDGFDVTTIGNISVTTETSVSRFSQNVTSTLKLEPTTVSEEATKADDSDGEVSHIRYLVDTTLTSNGSSVPERTLTQTDVTSTPEATVTHITSGDTAAPFSNLTISETSQEPGSPTDLTVASIESSSSLMDTVSTADEESRTSDLGDTDAGYRETTQAYTPSSTPASTVTTKSSHGSPVSTTMSQSTVRSKGKFSYFSTTFILRV